MSSELCRLRCTDCDWTTLIDAEQMADRLRAMGKLRRDAEPNPGLVVELFIASAGQFHCEQCDRVGLAAERAEVDDDWPEARSCEVCGCAIPLERLEVFPDAKRCVKCQDSGAIPIEQGEEDFCRYCGGLMKLRQSGSGITRYRMVCSDCGRTE